jgi:hypothetical protein
MNTVNGKILSYRFQEEVPINPLLMCHLHGKISKACGHDVSSEPCTPLTNLKTSCSTETPRVTEPQKTQRSGKIPQEDLQAICVYLT